MDNLDKDLLELLDASLLELKETLTSLVLRFIIKVKRHDVNIEDVLTRQACTLTKRHA